MDQTFFLENFCQNKTQRESFLTYFQLLQMWQRKLNLISATSFQNIWSRHFIDSAQITQYLKPNNNIRGIIDIGSGAGFPGLVISLLGFGPVYLVESNRHKANFLNEAISQTGSSAIVYSQKFESIKLPSFNFVVSRAFAPLTRLLKILENKGINNIRCIFPKGASVNEEIIEARKIWDIKLSKYQSITNLNSKILVVKGFKRV
jgi:16S rRNA (guanine(527)-N(7))-methyltransferase GidB